MTMTSDCELDAPFVIRPVRISIARSPMFTFHSTCSFLVWFILLLMLFPRSADADARTWYL